MASSAKRRAIETGQNAQDSDESSDEGVEDSGDEDSENSEEEINEVRCCFYLVSQPELKCCEGLDTSAPSVRSLNEFNLCSGGHRGLRGTYDI